MISCYRRDGNWPDRSNELSGLSTRLLSEILSLKRLDEKDSCCGSWPRASRNTGTTARFCDNRRLTCGCVSFHWLLVFRAVVQRLVELGEALKRQQLVGMRQRRENLALKDEAELLRRRRGQDEHLIRELEEKVAVLDSKIHRTDLVISNQGDDETDVGVPQLLDEPYVAEARAADRQQPHHQAQGAHVPAASELSKLQADVHSKSDQLRDMQQRYDEIVAARIKLEAEAADFDRDRREDRREIQHLKAQLALMEYDSDEASDVERGDKRNSGDSKRRPRQQIPNRVREYYEREQKRVQKAAQHTIRSLRQLLDKKNAALESYRKQLAAQTQAVEVERATLAEKQRQIVAEAFDENAGTITKLKHAVCTTS